MCEPQSCSACSAVNIYEHHKSDLKLTAVVGKKLINLAEEGEDKDLRHQSLKEKLIWNIMIISEW